MKKLRNIKGFTLIEVAAASAILVIAVTMAMSGFVHALVKSKESTIQGELDVQVQKAMERLKQDLRLSALDQIKYWPDGAGPYTAISFPLARDDDGDGGIELGTNGKVIWDCTVVFHVWTSSPNKLVRTVFDPRDNTLTPAQVQTQLNETVLWGHGTNTFTGTNATSTTIFENLFEWSIDSGATNIDCYTAITSRDLIVSFGTAILSPGSHLFEFTTTETNKHGKNHFGIDTLTVSACGDDREAEDYQTTAVGTGGITPLKHYVPGGWSGNYDLYFPATATGQTLRLWMNNDQWEETNFKDTGVSHDNTEVETFDGGWGWDWDYIVKPDYPSWGGYQPLWRAQRQCGGIVSNDWWPLPSFDSSFEEPPVERMNGYAIRVMLKGSDMPSGGWLDFDSNNLYFYLIGHTNFGYNAKIEEVWIGECVTNDTCVPDIKPGTIRQMLMCGYSDAAGTVWNNDGVSSIYLVPQGWAWPGYCYTDDWPPFSYPMEKEKTYILTIRFGNAANQGYVAYWPGSMGETNSYLFTGANAADVQDLTWSDNPAVTGSPNVYAAGIAYATFTTSSVFTSQIFDTKLTQPKYHEIRWTTDVWDIGWGRAIDVRLRSAASNNMSDAIAWDDVPYTSQFVCTTNPGRKRYCQFQARIRSDEWGSAPKLRNVTVCWTGETKAVNLGGRFSTGPDCGKIEVRIDSNRLTKALTVNLEIFKTMYTRAGPGLRTVTSKLSSEIRPRNTGK